MTTPPQNEPRGLFTSTAANYARHRPGIPPEAVSLLADTMRDADRPAFLDLGSGTGQAPAALRLLQAHADGGVLTKNAVFTVLLARRPGGAA